MCRLFGMLAAEPITAQFWLLGAPDSMLDQSHRNPDGIGLAHYVGREPMLEKHPIAAHEDREFAAEARQVHSHLILAHIRHATRGEPRLENTQPFVHGSLVFAHNGTIDGLEDLPASLGFFLGDADSLYALRLPGTEGLFVRRLEAGEDLQGMSSYGTRTEGHNLTEAILFASERIDSASSWQELEPGTLAVADRDLRLIFHST